MKKCKKIDLKEGRFILAHGFKDFRTTLTGLFLRLWQGKAWGTCGKTELLTSVQPGNRQTRNQGQTIPFEGKPQGPHFIKFVPFFNSQLTYEFFHGLIY